MKTRFIAAAVFTLFALAPAAFAQTAGGSNSTCPTGYIPDYTSPTGCSLAPTQTTGVPAIQSQTTGTPTAGTGQTVTLVNPLSAGTSLPTLINGILAFVVQIGAIVVIFMLVYVGYLFVTARGEPGKITAARTALLWTIVGALILLGAQAIALGIQATIQAISAGS